MNCDPRGVMKRDGGTYICTGTWITDIFYFVVLSDSFSHIVDHFVQLFTIALSISNTTR